MALTALLLLSLFTLAATYSFDITAAPTQCGPLSLQITNGTGKPPYTALVVPYGASPTNTELRKVFQHQFSGPNTTFALPYPASSNFVITVGDSDGLASGGTSVPTNVQASANASCLPSNVSAAFSFQILPATTINQCTPAVLAWTGQQDPVSIDLVIPGGQSAAIPITGAGPQQGSTTGFAWTPDVRAGTNIILVANDNRGVGTGGSVNIIVGFNANQDASCLSAVSPSSTAGTPAGAVQTGSSGGSSGGGSGGGSSSSGGGSSGGGKSSAGAIAGGVVGGVAVALVSVGLVLLALRRRRRARHPAAHGVDLLPATRDADAVDAPPELYQPEPFIVPPHSRASADEDGGGSARPSMSEAGRVRRYSALSTTEPSESAFGAQSTSGVHSANRKSPAGVPQMRAVNFVQHEDAGELPDQGGSAQPAETIELPPSYLSVRPPRQG